ncbi:NACHT, LRR and PYD domains-containing protein 10 [Manis javanica]|nr:NACHT, LRR and PYD domains-containing protein 10 [Manis javanica]
MLRVIQASGVDFNLSSGTWQDCSSEITTVASRITHKPQFREKVPNIRFDDEGDENHGNDDKHRDDGKSKDGGSKKTPHESPVTRPIWTTSRMDVYPEFRFITGLLS